MRSNTDNKSMDMEARDINFILPAYIRQYLFDSKNADPEKIIFPMFPSVPHPHKPGVKVPIEWLPMTDPMVTEIAEDGKDVDEVTPAEEVALDEKDKLVEELKEQAEIALKEHAATEPASDVVVEEPEEVKSPAKASMERIKEATKPTERVPKQPPGGDLGAGHPDNLSSRDVRADRQIAKDLIPEKEVDEEKEIPAEIEKPAEA